MAIKSSDSFDEMTVDKTARYDESRREVYFNTILFVKVELNKIKIEFYELFSVHVQQIPCKTANEPVSLWQQSGHPNRTNPDQAKRTSTQIIISR